MRTIVDLPEEHLQFLAEYCEEEGVSRAEAVRRAVAIFKQNVVTVASQGQLNKVDALSASFGLWKDANVTDEDGVEYQQRLREEWKHRDADF